MQTLDSFPASTRDARFDYDLLFDGQARLLEPDVDGFTADDIDRAANTIRFAANRAGKVVKVHKHNGGIAVQSVGDRPKPSAKKTTKKTKAA